MNIDPNELLTIKEFARRAGVSTIAVLGALARRELAFIEVAGRRTLHAGDVAPFLEHRGLPARAAVRDRRVNTPALTPDEWANPHRCGPRDIVDCDICFGQLTRHARAARALHGEPFGFSHADVALVRAAAVAYSARALGESKWTAGRKTRLAARYDDLAGRIDALLPPLGSEPNAG